MIVAEITLLRGIIEPAELPQLVAAVGKTVPDGGTEPVVISGRLPVWAFAALVHHYHPRPWVGTFDPRLGGAVVVASHVPQVGVGDVVQVEAAERVEVGF